VQAQRVTGELHQYLRVSLLASSGSCRCGAPEPPGVSLVLIIRVGVRHLEYAECGLGGRDLHGRPHAEQRHDVLATTP
jgi:hypothetical protein